MIATKEERVEVEIIFPTDFKDAAHRCCLCGELFNYEHPPSISSNFILSLDPENHILTNKNEILPGHIGFVMREDEVINIFMDDRILMHEKCDELNTKQIEVVNELAIERFLSDPVARRACNMSKRPSLLPFARYLLYCEMFNVPSVEGSIYSSMNNLQRILLDNHVVESIAAKVKA